MNQKRWMGWVGSILVLAGAARSDATGTAGQLDGAFGTGGVVLQSVAAGSSIEVIGQQSTGALVTARHDSRGWVLRRFATDGSVDTSFGTAGEAVLAGTEGGTLRHMVVDGLDRIVAVGRFPGSPTPVAIARTDANGALDASFGTGGLALLALSGTPIAQAVAIQPDDKIVVAGTLNVSVTVKKKTTTSRGEFVLRTSSSGALDTTFGAGGVAVNDVTSGDDDVFPGAIAIQSSGHIVVGGRNMSGGSQWVLTRFQANGAKDTAFGTVTRTAFLRGLAVDASDRILVSGWAGNPSPVTVVRYQSGGTVDTSYGVSGVATASAGTHAEGAAIQVSGGLAYVTATLDSTGDARVTAVRFLGDGTLDTTFGTSGFAQAVGETGKDYFGGLGVRVVVDGAGNVISIGERQQSASPPVTDVFLVRWLGN